MLNDSQISIAATMITGITSTTGMINRIDSLDRHERRGADDVSAKGSSGLLSMDQTRAFRLEEMSDEAIIVTISVGACPTG